MESGVLVVKIFSALWRVDRTPLHKQYTVVPLNFSTLLAPLTQLHTIQMLLQRYMYNKHLIISTKISVINKN